MNKKYVIYNSVGRYYVRAGNGDHKEITGQEFFQLMDADRIIIHNKFKK